jgi:hypothetical protein
MITINWEPSPAELRRWALRTALALGVMGALFRFVDWGVFRAAQPMGLVLWGFGAFALATAGTGTRIGLPAYWAWMGFAWTVANVIGTAALAVTFFLVITPLAVGARLLGRDRLQVHVPPKGQSMWKPLPRTPHDPERQF